MSGGEEGSQEQALDLLAYPYRASSRKSSSFRFGGLFSRDESARSRNSRGSRDSSNSKDGVGSYSRRGSYLNSRRESRQSFRRTDSRQSSRSRSRSNSR